MGGQVVLLQPDVHFDFEAVAKTICHHQVTYIGTVPSQVNELTAFLKNTNEENLLKTLHRISSGGKTLSL
jgi:acyl-coenzyme A synthetase/AMP-(fatty) acid ligase